jgi:hypothetical protein
MYGMCWSFGMAAMSLTNVGIVRQGLSAHAIILLWTGSSVLLVGVLYLVGGVLWTDRLQFGIGLWILAAGAGSVFVGVPGNFLVLGLAGGAGFGVQAGYYALRGRPGRAGAPA